jgi:hypothetical protein
MGMLKRMVGIDGDILGTVPPISITVVGAGCIKLPGWLGNGVTIRSRVGRQGRQGGLLADGLAMVGLRVIIAIPVCI